jgi:dolichyl-phosphate beta-glucosyltransferase
LRVQVPAYNEAGRITPMLADMLASLRALVASERAAGREFTWEVLVVDDGSKDGTAAFVNRGYTAPLGDGAVRVLRLWRNNGKGGAVRKGASRARGAYVLMADADGATAASDLGRLLEALRRTEAGGQGIAVGSRAHLEAGDADGGGAKASRSPLRKVLMWGFHTLIEVMIGTSQIKDTQCGFKLFTRETARRLFPVQHIDRWAFDVELLFLAARFGIPMVEVPVNWQEIDGSKLDVLTSTIQMAKDIVAIRVCYTLGIWRDKAVPVAPEPTAANALEFVTPPPA